MLINTTKCRFDSILVRLKVEPLIMHQNNSSDSFDSILVRLKEHTSLTTHSLSLSFDSILVRLKV